MASLRPVDFFGIEIPVGVGPIPIALPNDYPVTFRLTMAAIDPTAEPAPSDGAAGRPSFVGATLKITRLPNDDEDEDFDVNQLLGGSDSDSDEEDDENDSELDEDINGGPSDPEKSPKARRKAALQRLRDDILEDINADGDDENADVQGRISLKAKGKARALDSDDMMSEDDSEEQDEPEEFVLCTLDTNRTYQQPLDITINGHETVLFSATGTHSIYLTGNILNPDDLDPLDMSDSDDEDQESGEYDLSPDEDELELPDDEDESDDLDAMSDPRIEELDGSEDGKGAPKLVNGNVKSKNKNKKRPAEDSDSNDEDSGDNVPTLEDLISKAKAETGGQKLSKNQQKQQRKKMKNNDGQAIEALSTVTANEKGVKQTVEVSKQSPGKGDKKVQFAKTLVQGPTGTSSPTPGVRKDDAKSSKAADSALKTNGVEKGKQNDKPATGVRNVQGVSVDDRKLGSGPAAKKGDKVSMRYIGKLEKDKRVFDSNKKGEPFKFKLGAAQVIKGWEIGVAGMTVGGERRITIPAHLAYGSKALPNIPANSTLVFDLKLLEIK